MVQAKKGDTVKVLYRGKLEDGKVFDSSINRDPMQFKIGEGQIIPGFEQAVVGMKPGESKTAKVSAEKAYGPHLKELVVEIDRSKLLSQLKPKVGQKLQVRKKNGQSSIVKVTGVSESKVTLDTNHPLAGKDLTFDIRLVEIV